MNEDETLVGPFRDVWESLDAPDADERRRKSALTAQIEHAMASLNLSPQAAAARAGVAPAVVEAILRGRLREHSTDQLLRILAALGRNVEITVAPTENGERGTVSVREIAPDAAGVVRAD